MGTLSVLKPDLLQETMVRIFSRIKSHSLKWGCCGVNEVDIFTFV